MRDYRNKPGGIGFAILESGWDRRREGFARLWQRRKGSSFMFNQEKNRDFSGVEDHTIYGLFRAILLETLLVFLAASLILGLAWEAGFFWPGLVVATAVWLTVSPAIEFVTYRHWRRG